MQLKSGFKITIDWKKHQSKVKMQEQYRSFDYLIDPGFQGVNRLYVLLFENNVGRASYQQYCFATVKIKGCNVIIDGRNFFDQPIKNNLRANDNIRKLVEEMITQLDVSQIIIISKIRIR